MPTVKVPVKRFRECYISNEVDFLRVYGQRLQLRGFKMTQDRKGRWLADPPLTLDRGQEFLTVSQEPAGRVSPNNTALQSHLHRIKHGEADAIESLTAFLMAEADDRAAVLQKLPEFQTIGDYASDMTFSVDSCTHGNTGATGQEGDVGVMRGDRLAQRELCEKVMLLFGMREEAL